MINPEQIEPAGLDVPEWVVFDVVGELAAAALTERHRREGERDLKKRQGAMGGRAISAKEQAEIEARRSDLTVEVAGEGFADTIELGSQNQRDLLELLRQLDGEPLTAAVAFERELFPGDDRDQRRVNFGHSRRRLASRLKRAAGREILSKAAGDGKIIYPVRESFTVNGEMISASKVEGDDIDLTVDIAGEGFSAQVELYDRNQRALLELIKDLDGEPLSARRALDLGLFASNSRTTSRARLQNSIGGLRNRLNEAAGREIFSTAGHQPRKTYPVLEDFTLNGEAVSATKSKSAAQTPEQAGGAELDPVVEIDGNTITAEEMGILNPHQIELLRILPKVDTRAVVYRQQFFDAGFYADAQTLRARSNAFFRAVYGLQAGLKDAAGKTLLARTGSFGGVGYWIANEFSVNGEAVKAIEENPPAESTFKSDFIKPKPEADPGLIIDIAGDGFETSRVVLRNYNERFLADLLVELKGQPLSARLAYERDFHPAGGANSKHLAFRKARRQLRDVINTAAGREIFTQHSAGSKSIYPVTERFSLNGQRVEATVLAPPATGSPPLKHRKEAAKKPENSLLIAAVAGQDFEAKVKMYSQNQKELLEFLTQLDGRPLTSELVLEYGLGAEGDHHTRLVRIGSLKHELAKKLNSAAGRELLIAHRTGNVYLHLVTEDFTVNGQLIRATNYTESYVREQRAKAQTKVSKAASPLAELPKLETNGHDELLKPEQVPPLSSVIDHARPRAAADISKNPEVKRAIMSALAAKENIFDHTIATIIPLRTGVTVGKLDRYVTRGRQQIKQAELMAKLSDYSYRGLDVASVSAITGRRPSSILAIELRFLAGAVKNFPALRPLQDKVASELAKLQALNSIKSSSQPPDQPAAESGR